MNRIFEEFMKRVQEEQRARQERPPGGFSQYSRSNSQSEGRGWADGRPGSGQPGDWFDSERSRGSFQEQFERAKRAEAQQRQEEFARMERESEAAQARRRQQAEAVANKAYDSFVKGRAEAEKSGLLSGVLTGLKEFFKK